MKIYYVSFRRVLCRISKTQKNKKAYQTSRKRNSSRSSASFIPAKTRAKPASALNPSAFTYKLYKILKKSSKYARRKNAFNRQTNFRYWITEPSFLSLNSTFFVTVLSKLFINISAIYLPGLRAFSSILSETENDDEPA